MNLRQCLFFSFVSMPGGEVPLLPFTEQCNCVLRISKKIPWCAVILKPALVLNWIKPLLRMVAQCLGVPSHFGAVLPSHYIQIPYCHPIMSWHRATTSPHIPGTVPPTRHVQALFYTLPTRRMFWYTLFLRSQVYIKQQLGEMLILITDRPSIHF